MSHLQRHISKYYSY